AGSNTEVPLRPAAGRRPALRFPRSRGRWEYQDAPQLPELAQFPLTLCPACTQYPSPARCPEDGFRADKGTESAIGTMNLDSLYRSSNRLSPDEVALFKGGPQNLNWFQSPYSRVFLMELACDRSAYRDRAKGFPSCPDARPKWCRPPTTSRSCKRHGFLAAKKRG